MTGKRNLWLGLAVLIVLAAPGHAWMMYSADAPDTGLLGNSFVDIVYNDGIIWLASGRGISYSTDLGQTWFTRTTETNPELSSDEPSALFGRPGQVWMASSHFVFYQGYNYPVGDGISMTTDEGATWEVFKPREATNYAQLVYDIAGTGSSIYAACFHGGLIVRHDQNNTWEHLFYSPADSADWFHTNNAGDTAYWASLTSGRYYSCAVDTTHADTLIVYGGSARGVNKFLYLPKRVKMGGEQINDIKAVGDLIYFAHEGGITQVDSTTMSKFYTADATNGLGSDWIRKLAFSGDRLWAAAFDPGDSTGKTGLGLYYLDNPEAEWVEIKESITGPSDLWQKSMTNVFEGENGGAFDFNAFEDDTMAILYVAAGDSGVFRSLDSGQTWNRFYIDPLDSDQGSPRNQVYSIDVSTDSMFLGTRAGLVVAAYSEPLAIVYDTLLTFPENDTCGSLVSFVRHQDSDSASFTYIGVEPQTDSGFPGVIFLDPWIDPLDTNNVTQTRGTLHLWHAILHDVIISENVTILASDYGLFSSVNLINPATVTRFSVVDNSSGRTLDSYRFLSAEFVGEKLFVGSSGGYGFGIVEDVGGQNVLNWYVTLVNVNPQKHDQASAQTNSNTGLPGDWVVALDVQKYDTGAVLWAACRRVPDTVQQVNAVAFSTDYGDSWDTALINEQVWNFAFDDYGTAYAAASGGLFAAEPPWNDWERLAIIDPVTQDTIVAETEVFSVEVAEDMLWVGTELGLAVRSVDPTDPDQQWAIIRTFKSTDSEDEVFAAPVPFSPLSNNGRLSVHYHVEQSGEVTVEIYDFAMNLVRVLAENKFRAGGSDYSETWDGYNGNGDMVATGIYYIRVKYSTGELRWGRLAIIP